MKRTVAAVAVDNTFFSFNTEYSYEIPKELEDKAQIGCRVTVPFGRGDAKRSGIIVSIDDDDSDAELKSVLSVHEKALSNEMVSLAMWLKERCFCTAYDCLKQMLPRGYGKLKAKSERMVRLINDSEEVLDTVTKKQRTVVELLLDVGSAGFNEICEFCSVGQAVIKNLEKNGVVEIFSKEVYRNPFETSSAGVKEEIELSAQQDAAYKKLKGITENGGGTALLFGVTGSGKTQVYLKLIDDALEKDKDVIVMVPEISLTPQALSIFHKRYGNKVAVFHSGLSLGERNDEYKRADRGEAKIVIGTRSAVFAPLHNLGLIVMDEEQEHTYKSERTPRYNAKDVSRFRTKYNNALFLMGSATPSVETYSSALSGKITLCELTERYGDAVLPEVITVDMKNEMKNGNKTPISSVLNQLITENLEKHKQTILLINRRGYNTFIACNECGHIITCTNCSISLTYHSYSNRLQCHYCGYSRKLDNKCPECGSDAVRYSGYGTQRIEEELKRLYPNARILRMDADTTTGKFSHHKLLDSFAAGEYDILVGTQMVAKGLDFDNVTLVGVVNADNSLYNESYSANENSFDLITQVVGRAGRRDERGKAVIQTINPFNETVEFASQQDYKAFYDNEIQMRKLMTYPPYCDLYSITFTGENEHDCAMCAWKFLETMAALNKSDYPKVKIIALGPTQAKIAKINNNYRYRIIVKTRNNKDTRGLISEVLLSISKLKEYKKVSLSVDINPDDIS